ncbi:NUDIX hydrolase [Ruegeria sp. ANG-R]|uniref:NUDIX hydrolase n=1 Tax=Ruegeria sp. ANG-R TaxID=1577903 RepID=UPI00057FDF5D|nr:NUDIX hydrolase [Ruegeria sp. ANG-R]KIC41307.1 NUDIX hydrolase [Ruegeria sp. ANG-R]
MFDGRSNVLNAGLSAENLSLSGALPVYAQSAALCYRTKNGRPEILLITTRRSRRWIIPKGWLINGMTPSETAAREAWEEAGVLGTCGSEALGRFAYVKNRPGKASALCLVDVFPLHVQRLEAHFPEAGDRRRKWVSPKKASSKVASPDLAALLGGFGLRRQ